MKETVYLVLYAIFFSIGTVQITKAGQALVLLQHDYLPHNWIQNYSFQNKLKIINSKYTSYNNILFYEAIAKNSKNINAKIHHIAITKNNGKIILLENVSSQESFVEADKALVARLNSFKFPEAYKPNVQVEKHIKRHWHNLTLEIPTSWQANNTAKILRLTIQNARIEVYHSATKEESLKDVALLKEILKKVDITKNIGKLQQIRTKQGWETILMLSPKMKTDATTWMRAEYVLSQVIKGIAAQSLKIAKTKQQQDQNKFLAAIDKRNKAVIADMAKRLKAMTNITKRFEADIEGLKAKPNAKNKASLAAYQKAVKARKNAVALAKQKQKQGKHTFLAAIDKRNKAVIADMDKRLKAMTKITKRFEGDIKGLNVKAKKAQKARKLAALRKKQVSTGFVAASGGFGRWGSNKQAIYVRPDYPKTQPPALAKCNLSRYTHLSVETNCIP